MAAPGGGFLCTVDRVGPAEDGVVYIWLTDRGGSFSHWFVVLDAIKREMLATALAAISTGYRVEVFLASTDPYGQINHLYLHRTVE